MAFLCRASVGGSEIYDWLTGKEGDGGKGLSVPVTITINYNHFASFGVTRIRVWVLDIHITLLSIPLRTFLLLPGKYKIR